MKYFLKNMQKDIFEIEYKKLNSNQQKAVESIYGPVMVVAGPGTGKTQIIGLRTVNILKKTDINPENILITTFTEAGVIAIKKRLETFLGVIGHKVVVSTIHSFCHDVMSTFPEKFLEYKISVLLDDVDSIEFIKNILDEEIANKKIEILTNDYDKYLYLIDIKNAIGTLKQEGVNFFEFKEIILNKEKIYTEELSKIKSTLKKYEKTKLDYENHIKKLNELNHIYKCYQEKLSLLGKYDFNDMINFVVQVFEKDDELKYFYAEKFQFIMLDEFQDINNAQNKIINLILSVGNENQNIMVVGDDDQSIYRFQGANIENMFGFATKFPSLEIIVLENNYRSSQSILDLCTALINNNNERLSKRINFLEKKLISSNHTLSNINLVPTLVVTNTLEEEKAYLLGEIKKYIELGVKKEEIAIIVRNNKEVEDLSIFFEQNSIDVISKLNTDILKNDYINFILDFLECLENPFNNDEKFLNIARSFILGLNQVDIFKFSKDLYNKNYKRKFKLSFYDEFCKIDRCELNFENKDLLIKFRDLFEDLRQKLNDKNFIDFFSYFIDKIGIIFHIEKYGSFDDIEDIYTLFNKFKSFLEINISLNLRNFLDKIYLYKKYGYNIPRQILTKPKSGINILTAHSSKGLEYDIVFIPGLYTGNWDNKKIIGKLKLPSGIAGIELQTDVDPIEEERRLFFVACSRAKKGLHLSFPISISNKSKMASVFLSEIKGYYKDINLDNKIGNILKSLVINQILNKKLFNYSQKEFDYIQNFLENYKLSPTDLNIFLEDPLKFLQNIVFKYPFIDNDTTIFGRVYHRVLELFYLKYKENKKLPEVSYLTGTFELLLKKELLTPESFEKLLKKGINGLKGFYDIYKINNREILYLEYDFRSKGLLFENIPITGKIDKIEIIGNSNFNTENLGQLAFFKESVAIIDNKTGKRKSILEIKGLDKYGNKKQNEGKYFRQLMFYKLLCELDNEFSSKYDIGSLAIDFVEGIDGEYKYVEIEYSEEEYKFFKTELLDSRLKISNIEFWKEILF